MPTYLYEIEATGEVVEIAHPMSDSPLTRHPVTRQTVRRVYAAPNLATRYTPGGEKKLQDDHYLARQGLTKYVRDKATGTFHKTTGSPAAPDVLRK